MPRHARSSASTRQPQLTSAAAPIGSLDIVIAPIEPTQATVLLDGELDCATARKVVTALLEQLALGHRFVRLDLSHLTFLDCAGVQALVHTHNEFLSAHGTLVLTGVGHRITRLLRLTHLDEVLLIADGPAEPRRVRRLVSVPFDEST